MLRVVSFTAEPMPGRPRGTACMTAVVARRHGQAHSG